MSPLALATDTPFPASRRRAVSRDEYLAFLSLARRQHSIAQQNRRWMAEAEAAGDLPAYRKHAAEARRLCGDALWHLAVARDRKADAYG